MDTRNAVLPGFNGNYTDSNQLKNQLIKRFAKNASDQTYQICYMTCQSANNENIENVTSVLKPDSSKNLILALYYIYQNGLDVMKHKVPSSKLVCCNVKIHFDTLFKDYSFTTYNDDHNTKKALNESIGVIIFSNDIHEITKICDEIVSLSDENPPPFIFIGTSLEQLDISSIDKNITQVITCQNIISKEKALTFWETIQNKLDELAKMAAEFNPKLEKKCCIM